jgi:hypothetical protein
MTRPNLRRVTRWCAKWASGILLVATLFLIGCAPQAVVPSTVAPEQVARMDTVAVGRHRCLFLTLQDGTHALPPEQPRACQAAFVRWAVRQP